MEEIVNLKPKLHFFICTNDRSSIENNITPSCAPQINEAMVKEVKLWIKNQGLHGKIFVTRTGCLGGCNKSGGVLVHYPEGKFIKGFQTIDDLKSYIMTVVHQQKLN